MSTRIETTTGLPVFVFVAFWYLAFSGWGVWSLFQRDSAPVPPSSALLSLSRFVPLPYPLRSLLLSSNACTSSLFTSKLLSASVLISLYLLCLRGTHFVPSHLR